MISDLIQIENYMGRAEAVLSLESMIRKFGELSVGQALIDHFIELRTSPNHTYVVLTDKARLAVP